MNSPGRYLIPTFLLAVLCYILFEVQDILLPFVLGATLAYLLSPLVRFFEVNGLRRSPVVLVLFGSLLAFFSGGLYLTVSLASQEASKAAQELPQYVARGQGMVRDLQSWAARPSDGHALDLPFVKHLVRDSTVVDLVSDHWRTLPGLLIQKTPKIASHIVPALEMMLLVPFIAFLLLLEGPMLLEGFLKLIPARYVEMILNIVFEIDNSMGHYVRGLCLKSLLVGLASLAGFWVIGLNDAMQLSALMALTNVVPAIGPAIAAVTAIGVALFQWGSLVGLVKVLVVVAVIRILDDGVLHVVVLKNSVELHPILILFSLMAGGALWGFWGLLFGVPLACMAKVLLEVIWDWYRSEYGLRYDDTPAEVSHIPLI